MSPTALPVAFVDVLDSNELTEFRKGYRSFRKGTPRCPGELDFSRKAGVAPVRVRGPSTRANGESLVPSCKSMEWLRIELPDEGDEALPHLAASPFRLRGSDCPHAPSVHSRHLGSWLADTGFRSIDEDEDAPDVAADLVFLGSKAHRKPRAPRQPVPSGSGLPASGPRTAGGRASSSPGGIARSTLAFVLVWYWTGAFTNSSSKQALAALPTPLPVTLTLVQHSAAALCGMLAYRVLGLRKYKPLPNTSDAPPEAFRSLATLCLVYTIGFCLTNASFGAVNASFVDTVKAGEPITTVLLASLFLRNERVTMPVLLSLAPVVGGVGISSMAEASASLKGLAFAMGSNVCFSARSIAAKLVGKHMGAERMDGANLFVHVNTLGLLALAPVALVLEGHTLSALLRELSPAAIWGAARLFAFNGVMYYLNNQMNFLVLERVDTLTHGIINCGRRVANIAFAIMWFGNRVTFFNGSGISLALAGGFLYVRAKVEEAKAGKAKAVKANGGVVASDKPKAS